MPRRPRRGLRRGCCRPPGLLPALGRETALGTAWRRRRRHLPGEGWCVALAELVVVTRGRTLSLWVCWSRRHETRNTEQCSHAARPRQGAPWGSHGSAKPACARSAPQCSPLCRGVTRRVCRPLSIHSASIGQHPKTGVERQELPGSGNSRAGGLSLPAGVREQTPFSWAVGVSQRL